MPYIETQEQFNNRLKAHRLIKTKNEEELKNTIKQIVLEELKTKEESK